MSYFKSVAEHNGLNEGKGRENGGGENYLLIKLVLWKFFSACFLCMEKYCKAIRTCEAHLDAEKNKY